VRKDLASGTDLDYYYAGWQILEKRRVADGAVLRQRVDSPNLIDEHLELTSYANAPGAPQGSVQARRRCFALVARPHLIKPRPTWW
jgi:hypothetical protein